MMDNKSGAGALTRSLLVALLTGVSSLALSHPAEAQSQQTSHDQLVSYNIAPQPLSSALNEYARQSGLRALYSYEQVRGLQAPAVRGRLTREQALAQLLASSGYSARIGDDNTLELANADRPQQGGADAPAQTNPQTGVARSPFDRAASEEDDEEIIVTGTNIRGVYPASSPVDIYTSQDIARTGAVTTEEFIQRLPQNLGTRTEYASSSSSAGGGNVESVSSVDLRGLGAGTTLVLLNGRRMALASGGQTADISLVPASAIERVEVLTDGASAIYGSDAIGGVVNFVLRDDFEGAETRLHYGRVTSGDMRQGGFTQTFGQNWQNGNALVSYDYLSASALDRLDRDFSAGAGPGSLTPIETRHSLLTTFSQALSPRLEIGGDFIFSDRKTKNEGTDNTGAALLLNTFVARSSTEQYFANVGADFELTPDLNAAFRASYSQNDIDRSIRQEYPNAGAVFFTVTDNNYSALDLTASLDGPLLDLPAGPLRFSLGAGQLNEDYLGTGTATTVDLGRATTYAFAEILAPILAPTQGVPLIHRLELSLAARYTRYDDTSEPSLGRDFGDNTNPKIGVLWGLTRQFNVRATYGQSFRAPSLSEIDTTRSTTAIRNRTILGVPSVELIVNGPSPHLDAETADSYTVGFDFQQAPGDGLYLNATYFDIDYEGRIAQGDTTGGAAPRANPSLFPDVIFHPASSAEILEILTTTRVTRNDPAINLTNLQTAADAIFARPSVWITDLRFRNLSLSAMDGFDLSFGNRFEAAGSDWTVGAQLTRILDYEQQISPNAPVLTVVDTVLRPSDLRARAFANVTRGALAASVNVNYVDDYRNPYAVGGNQSVDSWTTTDLNLSYELGHAGDRAHDGVRFSISVQNLFDEDPPFVAISTGEALNRPVGFDTANANPVGRVVAFSIAKSW